jgi:hypothetical protein
LYFPHLKRAVAPLTENGIHWLWHSDGNIIPIADDIIACGIDGFQGFEEDKGMDLNALASKTCRNGKPPFLFGSINVTRTFYESPEAVRSSVARMCRMAETRGGGVVLFPSSTIMDDSPVDNVLAFFSADRKLSG